MRSTSRLAVRMPDGDFFWNACKTYTAFSNRTVYTARYAFPSCDSRISNTPGPSPLRGFAVGAVPPNCAMPRALPMSSLTAAGKLIKSRLEDPIQCRGFSSAARTRRTLSLSQFWYNHASARSSDFRFTSDATVWLRLVATFSTSNQTKKLVLANTELRRRRTSSNVLLTIPTTHRQATDLGFLLHPCCPSASSRRWVRPDGASASIAPKRCEASSTGPPNRWTRALEVRRAQGAARTIQQCGYFFATTLMFRP